jgi:ribosomal protein S14
MKSKDKKYRLLYKKKEVNCIKNKLFSRLKNKNLLFSLEKKERILKVKITNKCTISNKKNSVNKRFNLSRMMLKKSSYNGLILGFKKFYF